MGGRFKGKPTSKETPLLDFVPCSIIDLFLRGESAGLGQLFGLVHRRAATRPHGNRGSRPRKKDRRGWDGRGNQGGAEANQAFKLKSCLRIQAVLQNMPRRYGQQFVDINGCVFS